MATATAAIVLQQPVCYDVVYAADVVAAAAAARR